ncbi:MAG: hypothetical protein M0P31_15365 [Solirubrobacteraceae bacterium]|nr:hypothetical protein [Solirubrobacteraceae bacterium]
MPRNLSRLGVSVPIGSDSPPDIPADHAAAWDKVDQAAVLFTHGTFAARPAAGTPGRLYWASDRLDLYYDNGAAWVDPSDRYVVQGDSRIPSQDENDALQGTSGAPTGANRFVTNADARLPTQNENNALAGTNGSPSASNPFVTSTDPRVPTQNENNALAGTAGSPSNSNRYVTDSDARMTDRRAPDVPQLTALPGSPSEGDEIDLVVNSGQSIVWRLRRRGSSWECRGGAPVGSDQAVTVLIPESSTHHNINWVTVPLSGDYMIDAFVYGVAHGNTGSRVQVQTNVEVVSPLSNLGVLAYESGAISLASRFVGGRRLRANGMVAGRNIALGVSVGAGGSGELTQTGIWLTPIRITA